jgi:glycosyltransferase involved in cell wall biosynthesis
VSVRAVILNHSTAAVHLGGAERSLLRFVEQWMAADPAFEPYFVTKAPTGLFVAELENRGWSFEAVAFEGWATPTSERSPRAERRDVAATIQIIDILRLIRPDVVITNTIVAPFAAFAAKALDLPHVWFVREYGDLDHGLVFRSGRAATLADVGLLSELVVANSQAVRDHLESHGVPSEKLRVVYPSVDATAVQGAAAEAPPVAPFVRSDALRIAMIGRLAPGKGQARVIEAVGVLERRGIPAEVCFVGGGVDDDYRDDLRRRTDQLGIGHAVRFVGEQRNPWPFARAADVCVTASTIEAFGRTTLEYMLLGRAVVATRGGGSTELVDDGVTGRLVDADDPEGFADAFAGYAADPGLARRHGSAGIARAETLAASHGPLDTFAAIRDAAAASRYRLPHAAVTWLELPERLAEESDARPVRAALRVLRRAALRRLRRRSDRGRPS